MKKLLITIALLLSLVLMVSSTFVPSAAAQGEKGDPASSTLRASRSQMTSAVKQWTREARAAAKPLEVSYEGMDEFTQSMAVEESLGPVTFEPGGMPDPKADRSARAFYRGEWAQLKTALTNEALTAEMEAEAAVEPSHFSKVYNIYRANYYTPQLHTYYPYVTVGKLYFTTWDGNSAYCSASVFSRNNIIVTAAHCVYDTIANRWQGSWVFVPAERNFVAPYGTFSWSAATVNTAWMNASAYNTASIRYDVAVIKLYNNTAGNPVTYYTGYLGRFTNLAYTQATTEIGYPSNLTGNANGRYSYIGHHESYGYATDVLSWGSRMGYGASGSPILKSYYPYVAGAANYVMGVQSGSSPNGTSPVFNVGPRFSSSNLNVICASPYTTC